MKYFILFIFNVQFALAQYHQLFDSSKYKEIVIAHKQNNNQIVRQLSLMEVAYSYYKLNQMDSCKKILDHVLENPPILCFSDDVLEYDTLVRILQIKCLLFEKKIKEAEQFLSKEFYSYRREDYFYLYVEVIEQLKIKQEIINEFAKVKAKFKFGCESRFFNLKISFFSEDGPCLEQFYKSKFYSVMKTRGYIL